MPGRISSTTGAIYSTPKGSTIETSNRYEVLSEKTNTKSAEYKAAKKERRAERKAAEAAAKTATIATPTFCETPRSPRAPKQSKGSCLPSIGKLFVLGLMATAIISGMMPKAPEPIAVGNGPYGPYPECPAQRQPHTRADAPRPKAAAEGPLNMASGVRLGPSLGGGYGTGVRMSPHAQARAHAHLHY